MKGISFELREVFGTCVTVLSFVCKAKRMHFVRAPEMPRCTASRLFVGILQGVSHGRIFSYFRRNRKTPLGFIARPCAMEVISERGECCSRGNPPSLRHLVTGRTGEMPGWLSGVAGSCPGMVYLPSELHNGKGGQGRASAHLKSYRKERIIWNGKAGRGPLGRAAYLQLAALQERYIVVQQRVLTW